MLIRTQRTFEWTGIHFDEISITIGRFIKVTIRPFWWTRVSPGMKLTEHNDVVNENISALVAICEGNPTVTGGFPSQRPVMRSFDIFFYLRLNKLLGKQSRRRWFHTLLPSLWRQWNVVRIITFYGHCNLTQIQWHVTTLHGFLVDQRPVSRTIFPNVILIIWKFPVVPCSKL